MMMTSMMTIDNDDVGDDDGEDVEMVMMTLTG